MQTPLNRTNFKKQFTHTYTKTQVCANFTVVIMTVYMLAHYFNLGHRNVTAVTLALPGKCVVKKVCWFYTGTVFIV